MLWRNWLGTPAHQASGISIRISCYFGELVMYDPNGSAEIRRSFGQWTENRGGTSLELCGRILCHAGLLYLKISVRGYKRKIF